MYTIKKQFHFSASHQLEGLAEGHPCSRLHGHNYVVELVLQAERLNAVGFVVDYNELKAFNQMLQEEFDHRHLNDVLPCQTSAENIAQYLYQWAKQRWPQVAAVRVSETPKTWAEYSE
jgi:6-pyruvoyltetrahydropterin/6-carboxytetrahydropterin synthase